MTTDILADIAFPEVNSVIIAADVGSLEDNGTMEKLEELQAKKEALKKQLEQVEHKIKVTAVADNIKPGDTVHFPFGRGEKKRALVGEVIGTKHTATGLHIAVLTDGGFDSELVRIPLSTVTKVISS